MPKKTASKKAKKATKPASSANEEISTVALEEQGEPTVRVTKKRSIDTFLKPSTDQEEWLLSKEESFGIVKSLFDSLNMKPESTTILVPGVGLSGLGRQLYDAGFTNLTLVDVEEEAMVEQARLFSDVDTRDVKQIRLDMMNEAGALRDSSFDVILDKGCIDVFTRQSGARDFMKVYEAKLKPHGVLICFSMFHRKWKNVNLLPRTKWHTMYLSIPQKRYSRTRPSVVRSIETMALFVSTRVGCSDITQDQVPQLSLIKTSNLLFRDFAHVHEVDFPMHEASLY
jgi:hypothetical protein